MLYYFLILLVYTYCTTLSFYCQVFRNSCSPYSTVCHRV
nr:MAG TPA: hypothetical protein [Inoviridae sp.]